MLPWDRGRKLYACGARSPKSPRETATSLQFVLFVFMPSYFVLFIVLQNGSEVNQSAIREVLSTHKSLASNVTPTTDFKKLCVDIFKKYEDMVGLMIKCDPGFLEVRL